MMPPAIQSIFGAQLQFASFNAAAAFGFQHPAVVMAALAFVVVACTIPASERETGLLELVLARPIARRQYVAGAFALAMVGVLVIPAGLLAACGLGLAWVDVSGELPWSRYVMSAVGLAALLFAFAGVALLFGTTAARRGPAVARTVGLIIGLYLLDVFGQRLSWLEVLRWVSPFRYFRPIRSAVFGETPLEHLIVLVVIGTVTSVLAFVWFNRGDATSGKW
jgi:ABC-2 type transport system permease protein